VFPYQRRRRRAPGNAIVDSGSLQRVRFGGAQARAAAVPG
jgi:hypothetical protein